MKILYDISILGLYWNYPDSKTGIYRVVEEVLHDLSKRKNIEVSLTSLCSPNPPLSSINCPLFISSNLNVALCKFENTYKSRLGLQNFYDFIYKVYYSEKFQRLPKYSLKSIPTRMILKLIEVSKLNIYDCYQYLENLNYDIFHSTYYRLPPKELTKNLPRLLTIYDLIPVHFPQYQKSVLSSYFNEIIDSIDRNNDWISCISEYTRHEFCEYTGMSLDRVFVCPLAAENQFHIVGDPGEIQRKKEKYNIPQNQYLLCLASQLQLHKNISHLIQCFVYLIDKNTNLDINLVVIGTTRYKRPDIEKTLNLISQYDHRIIMTGYVDDEDLSAIYSGALAFVFPSLYEGFGLPILEAMRCGTPVISSNSTSLPEVVGDAGILIDPKDKDQLCQAMLDVLTDSTLRETLRQKGLERAKQFSWKKCADQTVEIYKKILNSK